MIGRQFGSGGHDIGKTFAENLGYWCISVLLISIQCSIIDIEKRYIISMKGAVIMAKSASVYARIDPALKEQAETILSALGIPTSNAIDMFFKQIVLKKGLPFEVRLPYEKPVCMGALSEEELNAELEKGYADILSGRTKPAKQAFAEMRKDFNICNLK